MKRFILSTALLALTLSACQKTGVPPQINFIGIGTGSLVSDINTIHFKQTFSTKDTQLVAIVSFSTIDPGTSVQATWFTPDERVPPLGRTSIVTASGAKIARFTFASKEPWKMSPYQLRIDTTFGEGKTVKTTSGSLSFFIGMKDTDIKDYQSSYADWKAMEAKKQNARTAIEKAELDLETKAKTLLETKHAAIVLRTDFTGDSHMDYLIIGTDSDQGPMPSASPGISYAGSVQKFLVMNGSGNVLLTAGGNESGKRIIRTAQKTLTDQLPKNDELELAVLPSQIIVVTWNDATRRACSLEIRAESDGTFDTENGVMCR